MAYVALYRKFRPSTFQQIVGQQHITQTLTNQIAAGRVSHAYLFCGTRGTGKTSTAKIFAKTVNCLHPNGTECCNACEMCLAINAGSSTNVIEIDAASNNSVADVRDLRETVHYPPTQGFYKVYIIDEIHMLSNSAFNALLKTLEEPPAHVVFILATTDPQKVPATIHSRCQRFDFKRISQPDMTEALAGYMKEEGIAITQEALSYLARISDGSMRDALSILDQCISFYHQEEITLEKALETIGSVDDSYLYTLTDALYQKDSRACLELVDKLMLDGLDVSQFVSDLVRHFRDLLVCVAIQETSNALNYAAQTIALLKEQADKLNQTFLMQAAEMFSELSASLKYSANERIALEITCIKICTPTLHDSLDGVLERLHLLEEKAAQGPSVVSKEAAAPAKPEKKKEKPVRKKAVPSDIQEAIQAYDKLIKQFDIRLQSDLKNCFPGSLDDGRLYIVCRKPHYMKTVESRKADIQNMLEEKLQKTFDLAIILEDEYNKKHHDLYGTKDENVSMLDAGHFADIQFPVTIE